MSATNSTLMGVQTLDGKCQSVNGKGMELADADAIRQKYGVGRLARKVQQLIGDDAKFFTAFSHINQAMDDELCHAVGE